MIDTVTNQAVFGESVHFQEVDIAMKRFLSVLKYRNLRRCIAAVLFITSIGTGASLPTAQEIAKAMTIGWNLGNTLEAIGGETAWGNPVASRTLIDSVKAAGFNTIRIPVAWDNHADQATGKIDAAWMDRVNEVVGYCINDSLYVILNIHWDNGWLENNCTLAQKEAVNKKQENYWTQIADRFEPFNGHLLFASANEPNVENAEQMSVLMSYHQTFIDAVRATGGNNSTRVLIVQGPSTDIEKSDQLMETMPSDPAENLLMFEVHFYTPWNFCGLTEDADWGKMFYFWGQEYHSATNTSRNPTWGEESTVESLFKSMKTAFVDKGIPVIIGEFGAIKRTSLSGGDLELHTDSREYYYRFVVKTAVENGMVPVYWDNGILDNGFSLFDRNTGAVIDRGALKALMDGISVTSIAASFENEVNHGRNGTTVPASLSPFQAIVDPSFSGNVSIFDPLGRCMRIRTHSIVLTRYIANLNAGAYFALENGKKTAIRIVTTK